QIVTESGKSVNPNSIYLTLKRMENRGHIRSTKGPPHPRGGLPARYYEVTRLGERLFLASQMSRKLREHLEDPTWNNVFELLKEMFIQNIDPPEQGPLTSAEEPPDNLRSLHELSKLQMTILQLLRRGNRYAREIVNESAGHINVNSIYVTLDRLEKNGY